MRNNRWTLHCLTHLCSAILLALVCGSAMGATVPATPSASETVAVIKVAMHPVSFDELKEWKVETPTELKYEGTLPLNDSSGKPIAGRIAPEGVYVNLGMNGTKLMAAGGIWNVTALYPDNVSEPYKYQLDKKADGKYAVHSVQARLGTFQGKQIALVDVNSDGRYDSAGVDQLVYDKTTAIAAGDTLKIGSEEWTVKISPSGNLLTFSKGIDLEAILSSGDGGIESALAVLNGVRTALKLQTLKRDPELERIGAFHIKYMAKHGITHVEDKSAPEYTADGARAGMGCVISGGAGDARSGVINLLDTFYHRVSMLDPDLVITGINNGEGYTSVNVHNGTKKPGGIKEPFCYPPPDAVNVRTGWNGAEAPAPIPVTTRDGVGETITLTFPAGQKVKGGTLALHEGSASGAAVDAWVSAPDKPAAAGASMFPDNMNTICLIAKAPLKIGTLYFVEATADVDGKAFKKEWSFTTTKKHGDPMMRRQK
jgi:uncharacterized protein YkwD